MLLLYVFWKEHVSSLCISSGKALRHLAYERNITFFKAFFSSLNTEMRFYFCRILFCVGARLSQLMFIVIIYIWVRRGKKTNRMLVGRMSLSACCLDCVSPQPPPCQSFPPTGNRPPRHRVGGSPFLLY